MQDRGSVLRIPVDLAREDDARPRIRAGRFLRGPAALRETRIADGTDPSLGVLSNVIPPSRKGLLRRVGFPHVPVRPRLQPARRGKPTSAWRGGGHCPPLDRQGPCQRAGELMVPSGRKRHVLSARADGLSGGRANPGLVSVAASVMTPLSYFLAAQNDPPPRYP